MNEKLVCRVCGRPVEGSPPQGSTEGLKVSHGECALRVCFEARGEVPPAKWIDENEGSEVC